MKKSKESENPVISRRFGFFLHNIIDTIDTLQSRKKELSQHLIGIRLDTYDIITAVQSNSYIVITPEKQINK